jgi:hypothetical protein
MGKEGIRRWWAASAQRGKTENGFHLTPVSREFVSSSIHNDFSSGRLTFVATKKGASNSRYLNLTANGRLEMPDMALKGLVSPSGGSERTTGSQHWCSL